MQFDGKIVSLFVAPSFLLAILSGWGPVRRYLTAIRTFLGYTFVVVTVILGVIDIGFYAEYHEQFNQSIFGLLYDDFYAILYTIWYGYPAVEALVAMGILSVVFVWLFKKWMLSDLLVFKRLNEIRSLPIRI